MICRRHGEATYVMRRYQVIAGVVEQRGIERLFESNPRAPKYSVIYNPYRQHIPGFLVGCCSLT